MRSTVILAFALACAVLAWLWLSGGFVQIATWAADEQRAFQNGIARTLRALRGGEAGAYALLLGSCFAYGFFHAIGPGHGKLLVGGYGVARDVPVLRLSLIALVASLGQAVTAIVLAFGGLWLLGLTRERMVGTAEDWLAPLSYGLIAAIGLWLMWRGLSRLRGAQAEAGHDRGLAPADAPAHAHVSAHHHHHAHDHDHHHDHAHTHHNAHHAHHADEAHDAACGSCGHRHGPSIAEAREAKGLRDALVLIAGIAIRPCTGALFVLIITWQMGIAMAGVAGTFAMALGTASVTVAVGLAASGMRAGFIRTVAQAGVLVWVMPMLEIAAGLVVLVLSGMLLMRAL